MAAIAATKDIVPFETVRTLAREFGGVEHRIEFVRAVKGVSYYNSSIDSSPTRTAAALSALSPERPIVICGGADKKFSFEPLADSLCRHAKAVVLTGETAPKIRAALEARAEVKTGALPITVVPDFRGAVEAARSIAKEGDIVLLSPSCTSFDAFKNFEERGDLFCRIVREF
jgi:UDP-N-acetylmuramoylalanine--D-glutamate ligase